MHLKSTETAANRENPLTHTLYFANFGRGGWEGVLLLGGGYGDKSKGNISGGCR